MTGMAVALIVCKDALIRLAKEFDIDAEYSKKEEVILHKGKICMPVIES